MWGLYPGIQGDASGLNRVIGGKGLATGDPDTMSTVVGEYIRLICCVVTFWYRGSIMSLTKRGLLRKVNQLVTRKNLNSLAQIMVMRSPLSCGAVWVHLWR